MGHQHLEVCGQCSDMLEAEEELTEAEERDQWEPKFGLQYPSENPGMVSCTCNPSAGEVGMAGCLELNDHLVLLNW